MQHRFQSVESTKIPPLSVMAGLVPAIHVFRRGEISKYVDARHKAGHDADQPIFSRTSVSPAAGYPCRVVVPAGPIAAAVCCDMVRRR
jgi:hypothetical protein